MSILVCANVPWLDMYLKTLPSSAMFFGPLLAVPLPWSLEKGVFSLLNLIWQQMVLGAVF